jgi:N-acetylglutamate synthase-like GNAT family acetyltransferase
MNIRAATASDQSTIHRIIHDANINPMSLDWRRFVLAEAEEDGRVVGVGQVKEHSDGSRELASIAVIPEWRGRGIAGEIIRALLEQQDGTLYLTCRNSLESFYTRYGFYSISPQEMTPYFRRLYRLGGALMKIAGGRERLIVMKREGG